MSSPPAAPSGAPQFRSPWGPPPPVAGYGAPLPAPAPPPVVVGGSGPPPRPAVIALGVTLAVTGALQWVCLLGLLWLSAAAGIGTFAEAGDSGALFHIVDRFNSRMLDGLAVPLFGIPLVSLVSGFAVLSGRAWTRLAHTVVGVLALAWSAWWLQHSLAWWVVPAVYVAVAVLVLWTPAATAWFRSPRAPQPPPVG